jgi:hypothetical protein
LGTSRFHSSFVGSDGSRQTALLTVVLPPTQRPCATWNSKSRDSWRAPSEYSLANISISSSVIWVGGT